MTIKASEIQLDLLPAAIGAAASIRPKQASPLLGKLLRHDDDEVVEAAYEAIGYTNMSDSWDDDDELW